MTTDSIIYFGMRYLVRINVRTTTSAVESSLSISSIYWYRVEGRNREQEIDTNHNYLTQTSTFVSTAVVRWRGGRKQAPGRVTNDAVRHTRPGRAFPLIVILINSSKSL